MIDILKKQLSKDMSDEEKLNRAREFLQIVCLKIMYDKGVFNNMAFVGGTALRILFDLRRFSEDIDFSVIDNKGYDFTKINNELIRELRLYGFKAESDPRVDKNVDSTFLKFSGFLKELGLSPMESQKLSIKVEVDTNPPKGGNVVSTLVNKTYVLNISHFDLSSMFATKLHACFYRNYLKGRDFYDFIWYLGRKTKPNFLLLNNAIKQTQGTDPHISEQNLKDFLLQNIEKVDLKLAQKDVERFLEDKSELKLFDRGAITNTIASIY